MKRGGLDPAGSSALSSSHPVRSQKVPGLPSVTSRPPLTSPLLSLHKPPVVLSLGSSWLAFQPGAGWLGVVGGRAGRQVGKTVSKA